ncbi:hypothetical protein [Alkalicoccus urumqiensis]|uniref:Uncharacterized protein n=1 Tax=Alkalicoccus urumqiensis TaxID=1548213 RepID=A0A2P6MJM6_ALKUR|nr:hypothetical protein [Alkalicoccus urumqiensis]PRO66488.1 hypothetical protein C6I21_03870 [Alkalicoccus urumqiensis]
MNREAYCRYVLKPFVRRDLPLLRREVEALAGAMSEGEPVLYAYNSRRDAFSGKALFVFSDETLYVLSREGKDVVLLHAAFPLVRAVQIETRSSRYYLYLTLDRQPLQFEIPKDKKGTAFIHHIRDTFQPEEYSNTWSQRVDRRNRELQAEQERLEKVRMDAAAAPFREEPALLWTKETVDVLAAEGIALAPGSAVLHRLENGGILWEQDGTKRSGICTAVKADLRSKEGLAVLTRLGIEGIPAGARLLAFDEDGVQKYVLVREGAGLPPKEQD